MFPSASLALPPSPQGEGRGNSVVRHRLIPAPHRPQTPVTKAKPEKIAATYPRPLDPRA